MTGRELTDILLYLGITRNYRKYVLMQYFNTEKYRQTSKSSPISG